MHRVFVPKRIDEKWAEMKAVLRELVRDDREAKEAIEVAISALEGGADDDQDIMGKCERASRCIWRERKESGCFIGFGWPEGAQLVSTTNTRACHCQAWSHMAGYCAHSGDH